MIKLSLLWMHLFAERCQSQRADNWYCGGNVKCTGHAQKHLVR